MSESLKTFLQDIRLGPIQNIGPITVVPLISDKHFSFSVPALDRISNSGYGHLRFDNLSEDPMLVPAHTAFLTKARSQDHATMEGLTVPAKGSMDYRKAICVEETQGGTISGAQEKIQTTLPMALRERAFEQRNAGQGDYGRMWEDITGYNKRYNIRQSRGHYSYFLSAYEKVMDEYVSEFEMVHNQVGFIVFAKNKVYGVERFPSPGYLKQYYRSLIKGCYGAAILDLLHLKDELQLKDTIGVPVKRAHSVAELAANLKSANDKLDSRVKDIVTELVFGERGEFAIVQPAEQDHFTHYKNDYFVGNVLTQSDGYPYFTFIALEEQLKEIRKGVEFSV